MVAWISQHLDIHALIKLRCEYGQLTPNTLWDSMLTIGGYSSSECINASFLLYFTTNSGIANTGLHLVADTLRNSCISTFSLKGLRIPNVSASTAGDSFHQQTYDNGILQPTPCVKSTSVSENQILRSILLLIHCRAKWHWNELSSKVLGAVFAASGELSMSHPGSI